MLGPISRREEIQQVRSELYFAQKYQSFTIMFNSSRFYRFHRLFAGQAFESNGGVSVTVMDGEEMVGRMADQVLILFPRYELSTFDA